MKTLKKVMHVAIPIAVTFFEIFILPNLLKKILNPAQKALTQKEEIDFDNLGPEIVKKEK